MKKYFFILLSIVLLYSCKKDYTCTCTITYPNGSPSTTKVQTLIDMRKMDAKKVCIDYDETKNGITTHASCELN